MQSILQNMKISKTQLALIVSPNSSYEANLKAFAAFQSADDAMMAAIRKLL